jgi:hypothetical protein
MLISKKCCAKAVNCFHVVAQFNCLKSYLGCLLNNRNLVVVGSKPFSCVINLSKCGYSSIVMPRIQDYIKNDMSVSTRAFKTKASAVAEPQGIHENVSSLQTRTRLQRRKRPSLEEEDSRKLGVWYHARFRSTLIAYLITIQLGPSRRSRLSL